MTAAYPTKDEIKWPVALKSYYRVNLTTVEQIFWWFEIQKKLKEKHAPETTNEEIIAAIRESVESKKRVRFPEIMNVVIWIFQYRRANRHGYYSEGQSEQEKFLDSLRREIRLIIRKAEDEDWEPERKWGGVWNIVCEPQHHLNWCERETTDKECEELEAWLRQTFGFKREWLPSHMGAAA
jgi:hypothetical protein